MASGGLRYYFARLNVAEKLIAANAAIFILVGLAVVLLGVSENAVLNWVELPTEFFAFLKQPWTLVTYSFFHGGFWHLFWNMMILYFVGRIFLNLFDSQRFLNVYILGVILGGLVFLLSYNVFPTLLDESTALIGASAGVTAVLIFICAYIPNQEVRLFGILTIKLWYIGAFFVLMDLLKIPYGGNIGGRLAHLGGALLGYVYARQLLNGRDIGEGFSNFTKGLGNLFKPLKKDPPLKTVYKKNRSKNTKSAADYDKVAHQRKVDAILDKISKSGYESLSKAEKDFLFKAGKED